MVLIGCLCRGLRWDVGREGVGQGGGWEGVEDTEVGVGGSERWDYV